MCCNNLLKAFIVILVIMSFKKLKHVAIIYTPVIFQFFKSEFFDVFAITSMQLHMIIP